MFKVLLFNMTGFLAELKKCLRSIKVLKIRINYIDKVRECVMKSLNVNSINELRDKFEGVTFYEAFYQKISGIMALESVLKVNLIDWNNLNPKEFTPVINLFDKTILVVTAKFGEFPNIPQLTEYPIILIIQKEERVLYLIGYCDLYYFNKDLNKSIIDNFSVFKPFATYHGLEAIILNKAQIKTVT